MSAIDDWRNEMDRSASSLQSGVLLVDWDNLVGAILQRGNVVERAHVDSLWDFANRRCGGQLHHAHMAAVKLDGTISAAMREHLIDAEQVRSTKEQADIVLTVLAMDYLHAGVGKFVLATGDQDFIPLISRLRQDGREVTVVYGDKNRLSAELRQALSTPGVESLDIAEITTLNTRRPEIGCRALLGLLELQRRGFILGGKETGQRTGLLQQWGVLDNDDENGYWSLIDSMTEKVLRTDAAVNRDGEWLPQNAQRTYLNLKPERIADISAIDFAIRLISSRPKGLTISGLRAGPLQADNGTQLDRVLDALNAVEAVRRGADDAYSAIGQGMPLGYLEQVWRVYAGVSAECYRIRAASFPYGKLAPLLGRRGIGQGKDQRAAGRIEESIRYAKAAGVIDTVSVEKKRHVAPFPSNLCRQLELAYQELYRAFSRQINCELDVAEVIDYMQERDSGRKIPLYGFSDRDRHRLLRVLSQSQLLEMQNYKMTFFRSGWGEAGAALTN
jgi:NYN domain